MVMRSGYGSVNYLRKADGTPISGGTIPEPSTKAQKTAAGTAGKPSQSSSNQVALLLLSGSSPWSLVTQFPGYCLANMRKMEEFATKYSALKANASKRHWPPNLKYSGACSVTRQLVEWCSLNIQCKRPFKQKQLYVHGPPNTLKTKFLRILTKYCTTYEFPATEDYFDLYPDPEPQLCYIDEFKQSPITIQTWNQLLQGSSANRPLTLKQKGKQGLKKTNPSCIMISNYSLEEVFKKAIASNRQALAPLLPRLLIVEVTQPLDIQGFKEALATATYATTPPLVTVSDAEMTSVLSPLWMLDHSQDSQDSQPLTLDSDPSSPLPSSLDPHPARSKRSREKELESPPSTDMLMRSFQDSSTRTTVPVVVSTSGDQNTSSSVQNVISNNETTNRFSKHRRIITDDDIIGC